MTLRDLTSDQLVALRKTALEDSKTYFIARHQDHTAPASFLAGFNAGVKAALGIVQNNGRDAGAQPPFGTNTLERPL